MFITSHSRVHGLLNVNVDISGVENCFLNLCLDHFSCFVVEISAVKIVFSFLESQEFLFEVSMTFNRRDFFLKNHDTD